MDNRRESRFYFPYKSIDVHLPETARSNSFFNRFRFTTESRFYYGIAFAAFSAVILITGLFLISDLSLQDNVYLKLSPLSSYNFVHYMRDYEMHLAPSDKAYEQHIKHSFALQKTLVITQKFGGSQIINIIDHITKEKFHSESMNMKWISTNFPTAIGNLSQLEQNIIESSSNCILSNVLDKNYRLSSHNYFELVGETDITVTYFDHSSSSTFVFSKINGQLLSLNNLAIIDYKERVIPLIEFNLPRVCIDMMKQPLGSHDERSEAMKVSTPHIIRYYERTGDETIEDLLLQQSQEKSVSQLEQQSKLRDEQKRRLFFFDSPFLRLRLAGTKWCGKDNDYNGCGNMLHQPTFGTTFNCEEAPTMESSCPFKMSATNRITEDVENILIPPIKELNSYEFLPNCASGPYCVADKGNHRLTEIDKACRQHDFCPYLNKQTTSCACDKTIRDRVHNISEHFGSSFETRLILKIFGNSYTAWPCMNLERDCGELTWFGTCTWDSWSWTKQAINKYIPEYCIPEDGTPISCELKGIGTHDADGRLWGEVGHYDTNICSEAAVA